MTITADAVRQMATRYTAAWNSKDPHAVAAHFAPDANIVINRGEPSTGRTEIAAMSAGFHADVPDLTLTCDDLRISGNHAVYVWTFTGHDSGTGNPLTVQGWEEWDLNNDLTIAASRGWFNAAEYDRQVQGG